jgi:hypothetical protein
LEIGTGGGAAKMDPLIKKKALLNTHTDTHIHTHTHTHTHPTPPHPNQAPKLQGEDRAWVVCACGEGGASSHSEGLRAAGGCQKHWTEEAL